MALQSHTTNTPTVVSESSEISGVYVEGLVAGLIGAATIAVWFFILDLYNGRPFYTPNVLGAALSLSGAVREPATVPFSMEVVKAMSLGAREYWMKPLSLEKLRKDLPRALRRAQADRERAERA